MRTKECFHSSTVTRLKPNKRVQQCSGATRHEIITVRKREYTSLVLRFLVRENSSHRG